MKSAVSTTTQYKNNEKHAALSCICDLGLLLTEMKVTRFFFLGIRGFDDGMGEAGWGQMKENKARILGLPSDRGLHKFPHVTEMDF